MNAFPASDKPVVILIGNYPLDRQESMLRFRDLIQTRLESSGFSTESIFPRGYLGRIVQKGLFAKWLGYIDKYILFPPGSRCGFRGSNENFRIVKSWSTSAIIPTRFMLLLPGVGFPSW